MPLNLHWSGLAPKSQADADKLRQALTAHEDMMSKGGISIEPMPGQSYDPTAPPKEPMMTQPGVINPFSEDYINQNPSYTGYVPPRITTT